MNSRKKLRIISITRTDKKPTVPVKYTLPERVQAMDSRIYFINQVPCKIEYTDEGIKVWVIN